MLSIIMDDNESDELFTFIPKHSRNLQTAADQKLYEYTQKLHNSSSHKDLEDIVTSHPSYQLNPKSMFHSLNMKKQIDF